MSSDEEYVPRNRSYVSLNTSASNAAMMSAGTLRMSEFKCREMKQTSVRDEWTRWIRGAENILAVSEIDDPLKKKQLLLAWGGLQLQDVFYSIPGADGSDEDPDVYKTAIDALTKYFSPKHHDTYERHKFWSMKMENEENIDKFLHRVRQQASGCNFGNSASRSREISIIDKVIESAPPQLKEELLAKEKLTLESLEKTVSAYQAIKDQSRLMSSAGDKEIVVNKVNDRYREDTRRNKTCERCGYTNHDTNDLRCPAMKAKCHNCGAFGHFQSRCQSSPQKKNEQHQQPFPNRTTTTNDHETSHKSNHDRCVKSRSVMRNAMKRNQSRSTVCIASAKVTT